uniref:Poly [ADP-ribose] polymerase n=1 Tax=Lingulaulax polyedra TaxID=160621 RepID=A0A516AG89_LINPO|nr:poly [ADP-ribose] polymerase 2 [Lingulodinium polyedra]
MPLALPRARRGPPATPAAAAAVAGGPAPSAAAGPPELPGAALGALAPDGAPRLPLKRPREPRPVPGDALQLLDLICDVEAMRQEAEEAGYDSARLPLERLSRGSLREAFGLLRAAEEELRKPAPDPERLAELSRSLSAAVCLAEQPAIDSLERLRERFAAVQLLADLEPIYGRLLQAVARGKRRRPAADGRAEGAEGARSQAAVERGAHAGRGLAAAGVASLKRPASPFFQFFLDTRKAIAQELGSGMAFGADAKRAAEVWRTLTPKQRRPYLKRYRASKEEYKREVSGLKAAAAASHDADFLLQKRYKALACDIQLLPQGSQMWMLIHEYVKSTQSASAPGGDCLRASRIFRLARRGEAERYARHSQAANRTLLWSVRPGGCLAAVLSHGLRATSPEEACSGAATGGGLRFTDAAAAAAGQPLPGAGRDDGQRLLLLAEVALGAARESRPPSSGALLLRGCLASERATALELPDGVHVPLGPMVRQEPAAACLPHNEYVVQSPSQVKLRYLVEVSCVGPAEATAMDRAASAAAAPRRLRAKTADAARHAGA